MPPKIKKPKKMPKNTQLQENISKTNNEKFNNVNLSNIQDKIIKFINSEQAKQMSKDAVKAMILGIIVTGATYAGFKVADTLNESFPIGYIDPTGQINRLGMRKIVNWMNRVMPSHDEQGRPRRNYYSVHGVILTALDALEQLNASTRRHT